MLGLVGESGSGKSTLAYALLGYVRRGLNVKAGEVRFEDKNLLTFDPADLQQIRGRQIALVPQNAAQALTPNMRIIEQVAEAVTRQGRRNGVTDSAPLDLLKQVRLPDPSSLASRYPHQLSGGQQQRVAIAMALAGQPEVLVLDEPTTGLDVTTQARILDLLEELKEQTGATMLYVSHDFGVIARMSDRVAVLYRGELVEVDAAAAVLTSPRHPYTRALLESVPRLGRQTLPSALPAEPADSSGIDCSFVSRRPASDNDRQRVAPELVDDREETSDAHIVRCRNVTDISVESTRGGGDGETTMASDMPPLLVVDQVFAHYGRANGRISSWMRMALGRPPAQHAQVLTDVTVTVGEGQTLAIVGESGSGKSTLARVVAGLLRPNRGMIKFDGQALPAAVVKRRPETRRRIQLVFQNPDSSLNPRHTIGQIVARPLTVFDRRRGVDRQRVVEELLQAVGLDLSYLRRFPRQLSGGERQRVAIARAFAAEPSLVLCDEVVSALDVSVQAAVLRLLDQLRRESGVSYVFISHDLAVVRAFADHVAVLYGGVVCELGPVEDVYAPPYHPYTETLLAAVLEPIPGTRPRLLVREEADSTIAPGSVRGCPFHDRCPRKVGSLCELELPPLRRVQGKHFIRCHIEPDSLAQHQENMTERSV